MIGILQTPLSIMRGDFQKKATRSLNYQSFIAKAVNE